MLIYLDACCLNRPFDDQSQERIRLESEAVLLILSRCEEGIWKLLASDVLDFEISRIPDEERQQKVMLLMSLAASRVEISRRVERRAAFLADRRFGAYDALHLACAEEGGYFSHHG